MPYSSGLSLLSLAGGRRSRPGLLGREGKLTPSPARQPGAQEGRGTGVPVPRGKEDTQLWAAGRSCPRLCASPYLRKTVHGSIAFPRGVLRSARAIHPVPPPAGARDRALPVGCHRTVSPEAFGTDPAQLPGPLPAGKLLCSDSTMHSKSTAGK